jgi:transcriptional regulator with AAA-type ATPase domain
MYQGPFANESMVSQVIPLFGQNNEQQGEDVTYAQLKNPSIRNYNSILAYSPISKLPRAVLPVRNSSIFIRLAFRSDLYYRLNVFPIELPPLRYRPEDIPELASHFVKAFARRMDKPIRFVPPETIAALSAYPWPGNIRELQNLIERAVIRSNSAVLTDPLPSVFPETPVRPQKATTPSSRSGTLSDCARSLISRTLEDTGWVIGGPEGAAVRLGLPRTSLVSKMKKLGISRPKSGILKNFIAEATERMVQ